MPFINTCEPNCGVWRRRIRRASFYLYYSLSTKYYLKSKRPSDDTWLLVSWATARSFSVILWSKLPGYGMVARHARRKKERKNRRLTTTPMIYAYNKCYDFLLCQRFLPYSSSRLVTVTLFWPRREIWQRPEVTVCRGKKGIGHMQP